jgi:chlorobactene glucosyltransferase
MNKGDFKPLSKKEVAASLSTTITVSVCIPARNEERNIERAVQSVLDQNYSNIELLVLDDDSTDSTPQILENIAADSNTLTVMHGTPKPEDWLGKSWACHQLSQNAKGNVLLFIDSDVWLEPNMVSRAVTSMQNTQADFITVWPVQQTGTFWEKTVIPIIYYGLLSLLPARYVHNNPSWLPARFAHHFAAACGQCMMFNRKAYDAIGGHQSVKQDIVEDVALAKEIKKAGFSMRMYHGQNAASCRMYISGKEMWQGFRKNFLALYNYSVPAFIIMAILNFITYVFPFGALVFSPVDYNPTVLLLSGIAVATIIIHRLILAEWFGWSKLYAFLHPVGVTWFHILGVQVLWDHFTDQKVHWKKRPTS